MLEHLGIRDNQLGRGTQPGQGQLQLFCRGADHSAFPVQKLPDGLHLGQNQAALRCLNVLGHYQQHHIILLDQPACDELIVIVFRHQPGQNQAQAFYILCPAAIQQHCFCLAFLQPVLELCL